MINRELIDTLFEIRTKLRRIYDIAVEHHGEDFIEQSNEYYPALYLATFEKYNNCLDEVYERMGGEFN